MAEERYREKCAESKGGTPTNTLFSVGWTVEELQQLIKDHQQISVSISTLLNIVEDDQSSAAQMLPNIRQQLTAFICSIYRHKRTPATNAYVMMISSEQRRVKPYALPIQLLPYKSIDESTMRNLVRAVVKEMTSRGMKVVGM